MVRESSSTDVFLDCRFGLLAQCPLSPGRVSAGVSSCWIRATAQNKDRDVTHKLRKKKKAAIPLTRFPLICFGSVSHSTYTDRWVVSVETSLEPPSQIWSAGKMKSAVSVMTCVIFIQPMLSSKLGFCRNPSGRQEDYSLRDTSTLLIPWTHRRTSKEEQSLALNRELK